MKLRGMVVAATLGSAALTGPSIASADKYFSIFGGYTNADDLDFRETRVVGHTVENQDAALAVQQLLGFGEVRIEQRQPSLVVDITVIVGDDFS